MALFDNDFIETIVTEGKDCDKDCKKAKDVDDEKDEKDEDDVDDEDVELSDDDKEEAEEAAMFDVEEASSIEEMRGAGRAVTEMSTDVHFACLEFIGTTIALDKVDVACTESYNRAETETEKEAVTEEFKDSVKKYYQKFKAFILKIKNAIVRSFTRVKQYIMNFFAKVWKKLNTMGKVELDSAKLRDNKVSTYEQLTNKLSDLGLRVVGYVADDIAKITKIVTAVSDKDSADKAKTEILNKDLPSKEAIIKEILGEKKEIAASEFSTAVSDLKKADFKALDNAIKSVKASIDAIERSVSQAKDLDSSIMSVKVSAVNKVVGYLNRVFSVAVSLTQRWVSVRVSVVRSCKASKPGVIDKVKNKFKGTKESMTLLDQFELDL